MARGDPGGDPAALPHWWCAAPALPVAAGPSNDGDMWGDKYQQPNIGN
jgi:hypothetical protein